MQATREPGDGIDPLDAYMASLAGDITQQVPDNTPPSSPSSRSRPRHGQQPLPSAAQLVTAKKVAASPFCDVLRGRPGHRSGTGVPELGAGGSADQDKDAATASCAAVTGEATEACVRLLLDNPAQFLSRFGHILAPGDLESLLPSPDPAVAFHVERLQTLMLSQHQRQEHDRMVDPSADEDVVMLSATSAVGREDMGTPRSCGSDGSGRVCDLGGGRGTGGHGVRNRRYRRLQQLAEEGVWFSDEAMKERDPWLWFEHVGKWAGEEKPAPKHAKEKVPGSTSVGTYLQESLGFLSQQPETGAYPAAGPGGSRGAGSSLGMAFLSGVCADVGGRAEENANIRRVPAASSTQDVASGVSGMRVERERDPDEDMEEASTTVVTAAVEAMGIRSNGGAVTIDGDVACQDVANGRSDSRRVRFVDEGGLDLDDARNRGDDGNQDGSDSGDMQEEEEEKEEAGGGREEVARILSERFLAGLEKGVDYRSVDGDERLDDLEQVSKDKQDRWFCSEEDESMG